MRRDSRTLSRAPPTAPSCSKMKSGRSTKGKNLVRGSRRRKKRAWTEMTKMIAKTQDRRDTLGNVQGLDRAPQPHKEACTHTKESTAGVVYRLKYRTTGARVCRSPRERTPGNTQAILLRPGSPPSLETNRDAPPTESRHPSPFCPGQCPLPTPLRSSAPHAC